MATALPNATPTRFVPFATGPGTPSITSKGTVKSEPPPASVFTTPATKPPAARSRTSLGCTGPVE